MEELKDVEKKILRFIYQEHEAGNGNFMLLDTIKQGFDDDSVEKMFLKMKEEEYIVIPAKSSCFKLTDKGKELCKKFFI